MENRRSIISTTLVYILVIFGAIITLLPFYWMFITSFMTYEQAISAEPIWFLPISKWQWGNYKQAFYLSPLKDLTPLSNFQIIDELTQFRMKLTFINEFEGWGYATFGTFFFNTVFTTIINTVLTILTTILAAFAFSKIPFKGRNRLFSIMLATMMVPGEMLLITNLITIYKYELVDTYFALIVPFTASVFYIYLLRQFFMQIPNSLYQAARVDGCSDWKYLWRVMVPMSKNTLITVAVLNAIGSWNAYLWPLMVTNSPHMYVLSVGLMKFSNYLVDFSPGQTPMQNIIMAGSTIVVLPMLILYILLRKQIISGVTRSGTKG